MGEGNAINDHDDHHYANACRLSEEAVEEAKARLMQLLDSSTCTKNIKLYELSHFF